MTITRIPPGFAEEFVEAILPAAQRLLDRVTESWIEFKGLLLPPRSPSPQTNGCLCWSALMSGHPSSRHSRTTVSTARTACTASRPWMCLAASELKSIRDQKANACHGQAMLDDLQRVRRIIKPEHGDP